MTLENDCFLIFQHNVSGINGSTSTVTLDNIIIASLDNNAYSKGYYCCCYAKKGSIVRLTITKLGDMSGTDYVRAYKLT